MTEKLFTWTLSKTRNKTFLDRRTSTKERVGRAILVLAHVFLKKFSHSEAPISAVMTSDPNLMNRLVSEEQNRIKLLVAKFAELMQLAGVSVVLIKN